MSQESKNQASANTQDDAALEKYIAENRPHIRQILKHVLTNHKSSTIIQEELRAIRAECPPCAVACDPWPPIFMSEGGQ